MSLLGGRFESSGVPGELPGNIPEPYEYAELATPGTVVPGEGLYYGLLYHITYFDLSGYHIKQDTLLPRGYNVQDVGVHQSPDAASTPTLERAELLLTKAPRVEDIDTIGEYDWYLPGTLESRYGLEEVLAGLFTRLTLNSTTNQLMISGSSAWGTGDATAGEKMYVVSAYKFLLDSTAIDFTIPHSSRIVPALIDHEDSLVYNMRLRRSYELQQ